MQVKVFEADDMKSALRQVKEAFGPDALILSTKTVRGGRLGLLGKPRLEVTAAIEHSSTPTEQAVAAPTAAPAVKAPEVPDAGQNISYHDIWRQRRAIDPLEEDIETIKDQLSGVDLKSLYSEIETLKKALHSEHLKPVRVQKPAPKKRKPMGWLANLAEFLTRKGCENQVVEEIVQLALSKLTEKQKQDASVLRKFARQAIIRRINVCDEISRDLDTQRIAALIGPTGVGKTTTIAKIAARAMLQKKKVALITVDIYRIAAAEQLNVYGEIMNIPVEVVVSTDQLKQVLKKHKDKDLVLIDTAGRSPKDGLGLRQLETFLTAVPNIEKHLVLSAATRERELYRAISCFGRVPLKSLIFTKIDECDTLGTLLNVQSRFDVPVSCLTNGQKVPEDLLNASEEKIADLILGA